jgi:SAM-dependent methyltransferase
MSPYYVLGLLLGIVNTARHRLRGYRTPRPFDSSDIDRAIAYDESVVDRWKTRGNLAFEGVKILELGPGPDLGTGAIMLRRGAASYAAADLFPLAEMASEEFYSRLREKIGEFDRDALHFTLVTFPGLPELTQKFDLIASNATLEHVADIPSLFVALSRLLTRDGVMCHHVDAKTHMRWLRDRDPLNILRYGDWIYDRLLSFPGAPNRLRAGDYVDAAHRAGLEARIVPGRMLGRPPPRVATRFRDRDDLDLLTFTVLCSRMPRETLT